MVQTGVGYHLWKQLTNLPKSSRVNPVVNEKCCQRCLLYSGMITSAYAHYKELSCDAFLGDLGNSSHSPPPMPDEFRKSFLLQPLL